MSAAAVHAGVNYRKVVDALADVVKELNRREASADAAGADAAGAAAAEHGASADRGSMQEIYVKTPTNIIALDVLPDDTILCVKEMLYAKEGVAPEHQRLSFTGQQLQDGKTLGDYNIVPNSTLHLVLRRRQ